MISAVDVPLRLRHKDAPGSGLTIPFWRSSAISGIARYAPLVLLVPKGPLVVLAPRTNATEVLTLNVFSGVARQLRCATECAPASARWRFWLPSAIKLQADQLYLLSLQYCYAAARLLAQSRSDERWLLPDQIGTRGPP